MRWHVARRRLRTPAGRVSRGAALLRRADGCRRRRARRGRRTGGNAARLPVDLLGQPAGERACLAVRDRPQPALNALRSRRSRGAPARGGPRRAARRADTGGGSAGVDGLADGRDRRLAAAPARCPRGLRVRGPQPARDRGRMGTSVPAGEDAAAPGAAGAGGARGAWASHAAVLPLAAFALLRRAVRPRSRRGGGEIGTKGVAAVAWQTLVWRRRLRRACAIIAHGGAGTPPAIALTPQGRPALAPAALRTRSHAGKLPKARRALACAHPPRSPSGGPRVPEWPPAVAVVERRRPALRLAPRLRRLARVHRMRTDPAPRAARPAARRLTRGREPPPGPDLFFLRLRRRRAAREP